MKNYNSPTVREYLEQKKELKQKRNQTILQMRQEGYSLQAIGDKFNCSREWIRLILQKEFKVTGTVKFISEEEVKKNEYTAKDISELTGHSVFILGVMTRKGHFPEPTRKVTEKSVHLGIDRWFWEKIIIEKYIKIKIKYLKIQLQNAINQRLAPPCPYSFNHKKVQELYKLLSSLDTDFWKGNLVYKSLNNLEVMKEFNGLIKPVKYIPYDYSKYVNRKSRGEYHKEGLYTAYETEKITKISRTSMYRYRNLGFLKEGTHFITGDHYFYRTMYYPEKMKQAMIDAGYDFLQAARIIEAKALSKKGKN